MKRLFRREPLVKLAHSPFNLQRIGNPCDFIWRIEGFSPMQALRWLEFAALDLKSETFPTAQVRISSLRKTDLG